jgi:Fic family protein
VGTCDAVEFSKNRAKVKVTMFKDIDQLKAQLDHLRPLDLKVVKSLQDDLILRWTYHSNAIEGNTLTLLETKVILENGITVGGKSLREHFEAINHREAIFYIKEIAQKNEPFSQWQIRNIHQLILKNIDDANAGCYRTVNVEISGASHSPPDYGLLIDKMAELVDWYHSKANTLHPIERAAKVHADFVAIHPFIDGNGRTSRLLMNLELMKAGYLPCILTVESRLQYYEALDAWAAKNETQPFIQLVAKAERDAFKQYQRILGF